jgi:hypothetical protein
MYLGGRPKLVSGFMPISATALKVAISGSILAEPEACFVTRMTLLMDAGLTKARRLGSWPRVLLPGNVRFRG